MCIFHLFIVISFFLAPYAQSGCREQAKPLLANVAFCSDAYSCAEGASALVIVTEWEQFRALDFARLKKVMQRPVLIDLRNIYRPEEVARHGFSYESVGRPKK